MTPRKIKIQVIDKTPNRVTIQLLASNGRMIIPKKEFNERVKSGVYEVVK